MDYVTTWGKIELLETTNLECVQGSLPLERYCGLAADMVELPIYQAIA